MTSTPSVRECDLDENHRFDLNQGPIQIESWPAGQIDRSGPSFIIDQRKRLSSVRYWKEGAAFLRLSPKIWLIYCRGAQFLHDDRHVLAINENGWNPGSYVWNYVLEGAGDQMLLIEKAPEEYRHARLGKGGYIGFSTWNKHAVSSYDSHDECLLLQATGFSPEQGDEAATHIALVLPEIGHLGSVLPTASPSSTPYAKNSQ